MNKINIIIKIVIILFIIVGLFGIFDYLNKQIIIFKLERELKEDRKKLKELESELQKIIEEEENKKWKQ